MDKVNLREDVRKIKVVSKTVFYYLMDTVNLSPKPGCIYVLGFDRGYDERRVFRLIESIKDKTLQTTVENAIRQCVKNTPYRSKPIFFSG